MGMKRLVGRVGDEARDLLELVLVPGLAIFLPWSWCFRIFRLLTRFNLLYRESCQQPYEFARRHGWLHDLTLWQRQRRLVMMVDHADYYLVRFRHIRRWMKRHMDVNGAWPAADQPAILASFHWGCGMWALWHAGLAGLHPHALVAPLRRQMFPGRLIRYFYFRARNDAVRDALGSDLLDVSASLKPMLKALRNQGQVIALLDVPPGQVAASQPVPFLGLRARMPLGFLRVAAERGLPLTLYVNGFRLSDGHRFLRILELPATPDPQALARLAFAQLEILIRETPVLWHYWEVAERFFESEAA
jgi:phosphatidylinositol dimannoside acyltransferase